jgi:hypothetical protein
MNKSIILVKKTLLDPGKELETSLLIKLKTWVEDLNLSVSNLQMDKHFVASKVVNILQSKLIYQDMENNTDIFQSVIPQENTISIDLLSQILAQLENIYKKNPKVIKSIY